MPELLHAYSLVAKVVLGAVCFPREHWQERLYIQVKLSNQMMEQCVAQWEISEEKQ